MMEREFGLRQDGLIQALNETEWFRGTPLPTENFDLQDLLLEYVEDNVVHSGMNELRPPAWGEDGLLWVHLPYGYKGSLESRGDDFERLLFTRQIDSGEGVHAPFTRDGMVGYRHHYFRVQPSGDVDIGTSLDRFLTRRLVDNGGQRPLEDQWRVRNNRPGTQFLVGSVLDCPKYDTVRRFFSEGGKSFGGNPKLIPGVKDLVATYLHTQEYGQEQAVVRLELPDPGLRSRLIRNLKQVVNY